ncbi:MAG: DNA polymerase III subunit delta, partial [Chloroflexi bacterium]
ENSYEKNRELQRLRSQFEGIAEQFDGVDVTTAQLSDLVMAMSLFATKRLVVVHGLSENKAIWADFVDWLPRISDDIHLILVESKPDKRTKTYKEVSRVADTKDFPAWTDRDESKAQTWLATEAKQRGVTIDAVSVRAIVQRIGVQQWDLSSALDKLSALDSVTIGDIETYIDTRPSENVFNLFEAALKGDRKHVSRMIRTLQVTDDPYMVFGLLSGQVFQLATLAVTDVPQGDIAKAIGAHPFALQKLSPHARSKGRSGARKVIAAFAQADTAMKTTSTDPWLLIERALMKTANS